MTITEEYKKELYMYILGIIKNRNCYLLRMNGIANHIHMLVDLHPSVALADLVKDIKQWSSRWLRDNPKFPEFDGWSEGYFAVSIGTNGIEACKSYIRNQERHHLGIDLTSEITQIASENGVSMHPDDMY